MAKKLFTLTNILLLSSALFFIIQIAGCDDIQAPDSGLSFTTISAPTGVSAGDGESTDRITITWTTVEGADYYRVYRCDTANGDYGDRPVGNDWTHLTDATYTDRLVVTGNTYFYRVKAFTDDGLISDFSAANDGSTRFGPPAPTGVGATKGVGGSITVTWELNSEATSYAVWRCETSDGSYSELEPDAGNTNTYEDITAAASIYYFYKIIARNDAGPSSFSEYAYGYHGSQPAPAQPTGLSATDRTHADRIVLTWDAGIGADSYTIYRANWEKTGTGPYTAGPGTFDEIAAGISTNSYSDTSSLNPGNYYYYITATNGTGTSAQSAVDTGCRSITDAEFVALYRETENLLLEKIDDYFGGGIQLGSTTLVGDIGGVVNFASTYSGTARVSVQYADYVEYYIIINGTTSTVITPPAHGHTTGTLNVTGIYPGTIELQLEVTTSGSSGGNYVVTQQGKTSSTVPWTE